MTAQVSAADVPLGSLLAGYSLRGAFTDCYVLTVPGEVGLPAFIEAFYTTRLFKLERWVLGRLLGLPSTDQGAHDLAAGRADRFAAWRVEDRRDDEILLDAGQTRSWLHVVPAPGAATDTDTGAITATTTATTTTLHFGSAVVPMRPNGQFGWAFHALLGFHRWYSRALLAAAARRLPRGGVG